MDPPPGRKFIKNRNFRFFDFLDPAPVFEVSDMALSIAEVWDFYLLLNASFSFRSGGAPGLLREYQGLSRSEKSIKKHKFMIEKKVALERR